MSRRAISMCRSTTTTQPMGGCGSTCTRRLADDPTARVGSLLVNPGGPGFGGTDFVNYADQVFDREVLDAFDIVGFDPRGTGLSEPAIDCIDDYDHFYTGTDITPDDDAERQQIVDLAEEFADACVVKTPRSSSSSARTTRRVTSTRSAGRSARRRSATTAGATEPSSAGRGRRCSRPRYGPPCSTEHRIPTLTSCKARCSRPRASRTR